MLYFFPLQPFLKELSGVIGFLEQLAFVAMGGDDASTRVWRLCGASLQAIQVQYGGNKPLVCEVRRALFGDGHVPLVAVDCITGRDYISHMDAARLHHLLTFDKAKTVLKYLDDPDVGRVKQTCFLLANHA